MAKPRSTTPSSPRSPSQSAKPLDTSKPSPKKSELSAEAEKGAVKAPPDRRTDMFGLTADQQRKAKSMSPREKKVFERHERYWRAREILDKAIRETIETSGISSAKTRQDIVIKVKDRLESLLKEHGEIPQPPQTKNHP